MDNVDNKTILKWAAVVAVAFALYKVFLRNREGFEGSKLYYEDVANAYPTYTGTDSMTTTPQPPGWLPPMSVSTDLLPKPVVGMDDDFTQYAPKGSLTGQNYLSPLAMVGTNTVGNRKAMSLDLRGAPPCPRGPPPPAPVDEAIQVDSYRRGICSVT